MLLGHSDMHDMTQHDSMIGMTHCMTRFACCAGPASSFLVISDPAAAKHVLRASDNPKNPIYDKGLVAEVINADMQTTAQTLVAVMQPAWQFSTLYSEKNSLLWWFREGFRCSNFPLAF